MLQRGVVAVGEVLLDQCHDRVRDVLAVPQALSPDPQLGFVAFGEQLEATAHADGAATTVLWVRRRRL